MGIKVKITGEEEINLTDFSVVNYNNKVEDILGENDYLSKNILGMELFGMFNIFDKSLEAEEVNKLSQWSKKVAHEEDAYRSIEVSLYDVNNNQYDTFTIEKGFLVTYKEKNDNKKGNIEYYVLIRSFDDTETSIQI
jgi:hypothetical protein